MSLKAHSSLTIIDVTDGIKWQSGTTRPANPQVNWAYRDELGISWIYDGSNWSLFTKDGNSGETVIAYWAGEDTNYPQISGLMNELPTGWHLDEPTLSAENIFIFKSIGVKYITINEDAATTTVYGNWTTPELHSAFIAQNVNGTQAATFYKLFNYDTDNQGMQYDKEGKLYINAEMIRSGFISADRINSGAITTDKLATDAITSLNYYTEDENGQLIKSGQGSQLNLDNGTWDSQHFKVTEEGKIIATEGSFSGHIDAASGSFSGHIEADSGKIGGFNIGENKLTAGNGDGFVGIQTTKYSLGHASAEYIESSGTQYINTGICSANNVAIEVDVKLMSPRSAYGSMTGYNYTANETKSYFYYSSDRTQGGFADYKQVREIVKQDGNKCYRNGELVHTFTEVTNFNDKWPIYLFGRNAGGALNDYGQVQIYGCKIWQDGNLVRNFEPAYKDGEYCLYESCFGQYYKNNGTGTFNGVLKTDVESIITDDSGNIYRVLEYIESSGSQHIETEVVPTDNMVSEIVFTPTGSLTENAIFGSSWAANGYFLMLYQGKVRWHSGGKSVDVGPFNAGDKLTCKCSNSYIYVNGTRYDISGGANTTNTIELLGTMDYSGSSGRRGIGRIESFKIWNDSGTIIRNYIPVIKNETEYGLYDQVNKKFYGNSGSGAFSGKGIANEFASIYLGSADPEEAPFSVTNTGTITANKGTIGNWEIGKPDPTAGPDSDGGKTAIYKRFYQGGKEYTVGMAAPRYGNVCAFWAGYEGGSPWESTKVTKSPFYVTTDGRLHATLGDIAGWNIETNYLGTGSGLGVGGIQLYPNGSQSAQIFGSTTAEKWMLGIGKNFGVTSEGEVYANAGQIGGVKIEEIKLTHENMLRGTSNGSGWSFMGINAENREFSTTITPEEYDQGTTEKYISSNSHVNINAFNLVANKQYTLTYKCKCEGSSPKVRFYIFNNANALVAGSGQEMITTEYKEFAYTFNVSSNAQSCYLRIDCIDEVKPTTSSTLFVKDIKLEEGSYATPWSPFPGESASLDTCGNYSWKFSPSEGMYMWNGSQTGTPLLNINQDGLSLRSGEIIVTDGSIKAKIESKDNSVFGPFVQSWSNGVQVLEAHGGGRVQLSGNFIKTPIIKHSSGEAYLQFGTYGTQTDVVKLMIESRLENDVFTITCSLEKDGQSYQAREDIAIAVNVLYRYSDLFTYDETVFRTFNIAKTQSSGTIQINRYETFKAFLADQTFAVSSLSCGIVENINNTAVTTLLAYAGTTQKKEFTELAQTGNASPAMYCNGDLIPTIHSSEGGTSTTVKHGYDVGASNKRWNCIYLRTSPDVGSDRSTKKNIIPLSDNYDIIFDNLIPVSYQLIVNESNRHHSGFIAQDVKAAIEQAEMTTQQFAGYCEWKKEDGTTGCSLRYEEFIPLNTWQIQKLKPRMASAEEKLLAYESRISALEKEIENLKKS